MCLDSSRASLKLTISEAQQRPNSKLADLSIIQDDYVGQMNSEDAAAILRLQNVTQSQRFKRSLDYSWNLDFEEGLGGYTEAREYYCREPDSIDILYFMQKWYEEEPEDRINFGEEAISQQYGSDVNVNELDDRQNLRRRSVEKDLPNFYAKRGYTAMPSTSGSSQQERHTHHYLLISCKNCQTNETFVSSYSATEPEETLTKKS
ncbi:unnamed protein product [Protopolystoma xenopodis]|uniref:Uncharacterized protein n=1 Tax=Protopolystoma xenopodis TaxID=117903 RepID=A0A448X9I0_9PLAT|nr:unnamed protein product [Protopolystoma xenopodis]